MSPFGHDTPFMRFWPVLHQFPYYNWLELSFFSGPPPHLQLPDPPRDPGLHFGLQEMAHDQPGPQVVGLLLPPARDLRAPRGQGGHAHKAHQHQVRQSQVSRDTHGSRHAARKCHIINYTLYINNKV